MGKNTIVNNIPAPYRLPLFNSLSKEVSLKIYFLKNNKQGRKWKKPLEKYSFNYETTPIIDLKILWINPKLPLKLLKEDYDTHVIGEYFFNFPTVVLTALISYIENRKLVLWSGVIETEHSKERGLFKKAYWWLRDKYQRIVYRFTDEFIAYCEEAKNYLKDRGVPEEKIHVGGQVMPEELLPETEVQKSDTKYSNKDVILSLGYLEKRKGIEHLIKAFKQLENEQKTLLIAGSGPDEERLRKIAGEDENIDFVGYVEGEEKAKYYTIADVFVLPTLHDPWGLVVNEALYYDNPVITTESAGAKDLIEEGENGHIVPPKDPKEIKNSLKEVLEDKDSYTIHKTGTSIQEGLQPFKEVMKE